MTTDARTEDVLELLSRVVRSERGKLASIARREGLRDEDALDCVQDALCTFLQRSLASGDVPSDDAGRAAFLAGIVRNLARNRRRLHANARVHACVDELPIVELDGPAADEQVARAEDHVRLRACVDQLCDTQRAVVTLRLLEERDGEDVASVLGITRGHVDVLLHRARGALAACMLASE